MQPPPAANGPADEALDRLTRLQALTAALSEAATTEQVADVLLGHSLTVLGADAGVVYRLSDDGAEFVALRMAGYPAAVADAWRRFPADARTPLADAVREQRPVVVPTLAEMRRRYPLADRFPTLQGVATAVALPLLVRGRAVGGLGLRFTTERDFPDSDRAFFLTAASLGAQALDRAGLLDTERAARDRAERAEAGRRRAEAESLHDRERLDLVVNSVDVGLWYCDLPFDKLLWNAKVKEHFGLPPDAEVTIDTFYERLHPDDRERTRQAVERSIRDRTGYDIEYRTVGPDGRVRWVRALGRTFCDSAGRPVRFDGITVDVTERVRAAEELRRRAEEVEKLMDVLPVGVFLAHDAGCRVITGNRAGYEMLGLPPGTNLSLTAPPGQAPPYVALRDGKPLPPEELPMQFAAAHDVVVRDAEVDHAYPDGRTLHLLGSAAPLHDPQGRVRGCVASFVDITQRKRAEAELREADRRKDEFLAMLAHELRNPLAPIRNAAQVMKLAGADERSLTWSREIIERQVQLLSRLVDDLLDVSRITRGKIRLKKEPVDLASVVARAVETSRPLIDARRHELTVALPPETIVLDADPTRLAQVLSNLLANSAKYTPEGGRIALSARREGEQVVLRVADNGTGIPADLLPKVFDLFVQADRSLARSEGGLGIGLTLVKRLVELHGGAVEAHSAGPGRGTEMVVRLPVPPPRPRAAAGEPGGARRPGPGRRVLVEDNVDSAESLAVLLRLLGHEVRTAHDGFAGLEAARAWRPEVVLLDLGLPQMDGFEVARRLRRDGGGPGVLLVALTGYGQEEDRRRSREAGFDAHLTKPADLAALQALLASPGAGG